MITILILMQILGMMTGCCFVKFYKNGWVPQKYVTEGENPDKQSTPVSNTMKPETPSANSFRGMPKVVRKAEAVSV